MDVAHQKKKTANGAKVKVTWKKRRSRIRRVQMSEMCMEALVGHISVMASYEFPRSRMDQSVRNRCASPASLSGVGISDSRESLVPAANVIYRLS